MQISWKSQQTAGRRTTPHRSHRRKAIPYCAAARATHSQLLYNRLLSAIQSSTWRSMSSGSSSPSATPHLAAFIAASAFGPKISHKFLRSLAASEPVSDKHLCRPQLHIGIGAVIGCADAYGAIILPGVRPPPPPRRGSVVRGLRWAQLCPIVTLPSLRCSYDILAS